MRDISAVEEDILALLSTYSDRHDALNILACVTAMVCPDLDESEVQEHLCDVAFALERAAGRAENSNSAWVTYTVK